MIAPSFRWFWSSPLRLSDLFLKVYLFILSILQNLYRINKKSGPINNLNILKCNSFSSTFFLFQGMCYIIHLNFFSCCTNQEYWINFRKANKMGEILRSIYLFLLNNNLNVRRFLARRWPIKLYLTFLQFGQIWFLWSSHWGSFSPFSFLYVSLFFIRGEKIRLLYKFCVRETMLDLSGTIKL